MTGRPDPVRSFRAAVNPHQVDVLERIGLLRTFVEAEGEHVVDSDGRRYLDLSAEHGAAILGHRHPRVVAALGEVLRGGSPFIVPLGLSTHAGWLAQRLCELAGPPLARVYFCTGGSEAVENAMKFAMAATGRAAFVSFGGGFHGFTPGPLPLAGHDFWRRPLPNWAPEGRYTVPYGDVEALAKVLARGDVAAVFVEAVQGLGGARGWPPGDLREVARVCAAHGTLLVADEILTGIGRTGTWFAYQDAGIMPDIVVVSKGLSGGIVPVAAVLMSQAVHESVYSSPGLAFVHSSTFQGHLLGMVAGLTVLDVVETDGLLARATATGRRLYEGLAALRDEGVGLRGVRGRGLLLGVQIEGLAEPTAADGAFACMSALHRRGVLVESALHDQSWLRLTPPLTLSDTAVSHALHTLRESLIELAGQRGRPGRGPAAGAR